MTTEQTEDLSAKLQMEVWRAIRGAIEESVAFRDTSPLELASLISHVLAHQIVIIYTTALGYDLSIEEIRRVGNRLVAEMMKKYPNPAYADWQPEEPLTSP